MTTKLEQAARQALEALEIIKAHSMNWWDLDDDITALREALAEQAEQEPVAFKFPRNAEPRTGGWTIDHKIIRSVDDAIEDNEFKPCLEGVEQVLLALEKVYAAPVRTKDLTPDVCGEVCARAKLCYGCNKDLEEANAKYAEQAEQEPIGVVAPNNGISWRIGQEPLPPRTKLYAASRPEQEPVALRFPTHLRKMWSGSEVQAWIDEQLAEQAEQEPVAAIKECLTAANTKIPAFLRRAGSFGD